MCGRIREWRWVVRDEATHRGPNAEVYGVPPPGPLRIGMGPRVPVGAAVRFRVIFSPFRGPIITPAAREVEAVGGAVMFRPVSLIVRAQKRRRPITLEIAPLRRLVEIASRRRRDRGGILLPRCTRRGSRQPLVPLGGGWAAYELTRALKLA